MTPEQKLRGTNLNLLPILHAILRHRSLTRAAAELNVTQSAASNSLRRLREIFGDDLLVKDGREMRLTEAAKRLVAPLEETIRSIEGFLDDRPFDPATAVRRFRIGTADYVVAVLMPRLLPILAAEAPGVSIQLVTARRRSAADLSAEHLDLIIGPRQILFGLLFETRNRDRDFKHESLFVDRFVCVARAGARIPRRMTIADYLKRPHAAFYMDLDTHASLEQAYLLEHGLEQFDRIQTASFALLPMIAAESDCLALMPESLARLTAPRYRLEVRPSPLPVPDLDLVTVWHRRRHGDADLAWLRATLARCVPDVASRPG